jgi:hypothetical protein
MVTDRIGADAADLGNEKSSCVAQRFLASLESLVESEDAERRSTQARALVNRAIPKGMFGSTPPAHGDLALATRQTPLLRPASPWWCALRPDPVDFFSVISGFH